MYQSKSNTQPTPRPRDFLPLPIPSSRARSLPALRGQRKPPFPLNSPRSLPLPFGYHLRITLFCLLLLLVPPPAPADIHPLLGHHTLKLAPQRLHSAELVADLAKTAVSYLGNFWGGLWVGGLGGGNRVVAVVVVVVVIVF